MKNQEERAFSEECPFVLGTAGHIDHGKTSLVKAMTGYDCDRLKEEKKRGITIELGFAPLVMPDGSVISVVDVPGHERFIRQMVAGAAGIQGVLFVVAADEGVMPQTREHLDILTLLGISHGVIALTKKDLVDEEILQLALEDVRSVVKDTFLEKAPIVPVSSYTGEGIPEFVRELAAMVRSAPLRSLESIFFYPIDRVFPKQGFGTVVTGTAWGGIVQTGEELQLLPKGYTLKVRALQVHNREVIRAVGGQRIAINLSGGRGDPLERGDVLVPPGFLVPSSCCNVMFRVLPSSGNGVRHWQRVHIHMGTSETVGRIVFFDRKDALAGDSLPAQLVLETPQAMLRGQRFIVRSYSPVRTIGGGEVVFPYGKKARGKKERIKQELVTRELHENMESPERYLLHFLENVGCMEENKGIEVAQIPRKDFYVLLESLKNKKELFLFGDKNRIIVSRNYMKETGNILEEELCAILSRERGLRGIPFEKLLFPRFCTKDLRVLRSVAEKLCEIKSSLLLQEDLFRHKDFMEDLDLLYREKLPLLMDFCRRRGMQFPLMEEAREELGLSDKSMASLLGEAKVARDIALVGENMILSRDQETRVLSILEEFEGDITLSAVRDRLESSRKYVLPLLEYLDSRGYTRRVGDKRILRKGRPK